MDLQKRRNNINSFHKLKTTIMKKETQVSFKISLELKKAVDLYCLLKQIKRQDYFRNLVESDKKLNQTK